MHAKEGGNVELKIIITHNLGDVLRSIEEWMNISIGSRKAFLLHMQPNIISHLKILWHLMLIMALFVLVIGLL